MAGEVEKRLDQKYQTLKGMVSQFAGYPTNAAFDYSALYPFFEMPLNNVGDATQSSNYHLNTHEFENEVVSFVAELYGNKEHHWGYITNGGSEGNLCGLHIARHRHPDGVVYYSEHSHYSIPKAIEITRSHSVVLPVLDNGEMDYDALAEALKQHPGKPAIIMANLGTTMTGAIDDVHRIRAILKQHKVKDCYIHCDGALHGLILPFCDVQPPIQMVDFDSLSISGHKFIGSPIPCGIFITHQHIIESQQRYIEYVRISDSTLTGSRNAITPLILWYAIHHHGYDRLKKIATACLQTTQYAVKTMQQQGIQAWANPHSPIVVFPKPSDAVIEKWSLAPYQGIAHVVTVAHITHEIIDELVIDLVKDQAGEAVAPRTSEPPVAPNDSMKTWAGITVAILGAVAAAGVAMLD